MTLISNQDSLEEGFIRSALEIIANPGKRSSVVARSDHQTVRQLLDQAPRTTLFTQSMAEFYLAIPRRQFEALKRAHSNPFAKSVGRPKMISKDDLLTWFGLVNKSVHAMPEKFEGRLGRTANGTPFIVMRDKHKKINRIISHAGITTLDLDAIEEAFARGAKIAALGVDQALMLPWANLPEKCLWRQAYRIHIDRTHSETVALLDRQELDEATVISPESTVS
ncbi:hypothetical protein [Stenotrophomonas sp. 364]|uniref:hypothetical protein n=1 Tax=Stenotrophomonas sp. 364 TaxID=2691571 RepID=UPI001316B7DE|nr:hypothetical protein [Stenotrophomonas sp. 364]QHB70627.1 hypothetical protein GQ674_04520 [Stenotrophomonas sp. 364]